MLKKLFSFISFLFLPKEDPYLLALRELYEGGYTFLHPIHDVTNPREYDPHYWVMISSVARQAAFKPEYSGYQGLYDQVEFLRQSAERLRNIWKEISLSEIKEDLYELVHELEAKEASRLTAAIKQSEEFAS